MGTMPNKKLEIDETMQKYINRMYQVLRLVKRWRKRGAYI